MRRGSKKAWKRTLVLILVCFWVITGAVFLMNLETPRGAARVNDRPALASPAATEGAPGGAPTPSRPVTMPAPPIPVPPADVPPATGEAGAISDADLAYLRSRNLLIPVMGISADALRDSFFDPRSEGRIHQAIDIMAPQGTPVLAAADGKIMKLYESDKGGILLYQEDASGPYVYYYGHLMGYADGMVEGRQIRRGEVIAYVGDTGNAGAGNYHLHFGISKMAAPGKWSGGVPINPYPLLTGE
ncbi:MAG TPA: M23 family metallopeptidase [Blastocatellia bacterium]|nr:M23 family metallopeptidase [Blastocatellia bacterium]